MLSFAIRHSAIGICALLCATGCATRPKTYHAPSDAKVKAATADLNVKVTRARETAAKAKIATEEANSSAQRLIALAKTTADKIAILKQKLSLEYRPLVDDVQAAHDAQAQEEDLTREKVNNAVGWNTQLAAQLTDAENARQTLQAEQNEYAGGAAGLAQDATDERNARIDAEKQLSTQRWFGWLWKIGAFLLIGLIVVILVLKALGKLGVVAARIAAKV